MVLYLKVAVHLNILICGLCVCIKGREKERCTVYLFVHKKKRERPSCQVGSNCGKNGQYSGRKERKVFITSFFYFFLMRALAEGQCFPERLHLKINTNIK
jgi:hypothetical protein